MVSIKSLVLLFIAASLITINACKSEEKGQPVAQSSNEAVKPVSPALNKTAAAIVNGTVINKNRVEMMVKQNVEAGQPDTPEMRKSITDKLILQMLVVEDAINKGIDKSPEVIEQIEMTKQSALANAYVQNYIKNNMVNDDMLKAEYDKIKATMSGSEYKIRHILVEKEDEALEIITELKKKPGCFRENSYGKIQGRQICS